MFPLSKVLTLTSLISGVTGLSSYLIPYYLSNKSHKLFKRGESFYKSKDTENFSNKETKTLKELSDLFSKLNKALRESKELKDLMNNKMLDFFKSISLTEGKLQELLKKHIDIFEKLSKLFVVQSFQEKEKMKKQANLESIKNSKELLKQLNAGVGAWSKLFEEFISEIDKQEKNNNSSTEGGALQGKEEINLKKS